MSCSTCGTENKPGRAFCVECGTRLGSVCPSCGSPFEPGEKFCGTCGSALGPGTGPDEPEAKRAADEARPILERLRAKPYLAKLDEVMASARTGAAGAVDRRADPSPATSPAEAH